MKRLIAIPLMLLVLLGNSQDSKISVTQSPGSYSDGWSFGLQYEHQTGIVYYGVEIYIFPNLHDMPYSHYIGRFGFKHEFKFLIPMRVFIGGRAGLINREGSFGYALLGLGSGIDFFIPKTPFFVGLSIATDEKTDSKRWGNDDSHNVKSGFFRIGITF